jgi:hypothetical protein
MSGFAFDAKAALHQARKCRGLPTLPTLPTDHPAGAEKVGTVGKVGTVRASDLEMTPDECARDTFEERAAIPEHDGGQDRKTAERAAWPEARRAAGITAVDDWRREADDPLNPDNWK